MSIADRTTLPALLRRLEGVPGLSERKVRLFAAACCRGVWEFLPVGPAREAVEVAERYADGAADEQERRRSLGRFMDAVQGRRGQEFTAVPLRPGSPAVAVILAIRRGERFLSSWSYTALADGAVASPGTVSAIANVWAWHARARLLQQAPLLGRLGVSPRTLCRWADSGEGPVLDGVVASVDSDRLLTRLVADVFELQLRPVAWAPAWRTETAVSLAQGMYEARDFTPMPVLADALEDAGCTEAGILAHCRKPGLHVRGCWVVDLVLGKS
jgi:hypothetical protein